MKRRAFLQALSTLPCAGAAWGCRRAPARKDGRTIATLWFSYGGKNREVLLDLVKRFNESQPSVRVEATFQGDYFEALAKLRTALAAKVAPTFSHVVGEVVPYLAEANVLEPLDGYEGAGAIAFVPALAQSGAYLRDRSGRSRLAGTDFQRSGSRSLVAIPFNRSTPIMYLNGSILEKERMKPPRTWDELREAARALTRKGEGARWGYEVPISWWFWVAMVGQAGGTLMGEDGDPTLGGEAGEKALAFWQRLVHEDKVMRPPPGRDYNAWQATNQDFLAGKAAIIWTSTAFLRYLEENARFPVVAANLPYDVRPAVPTGGTFFTVLRQAPREEKEAAWSFLRWMCEPEQTIEWATRTGYLPVTERAVQRLRETGYYAKHPNDEIALSQLAHVEPWPWATELFRIQRDVVEPRLERAVFDGTNARAVMSEARAVARAQVARSR